MEIVFSLTQENDGGFVAGCLSHDIFTQGNIGEELRANVREAVSAYFFDSPKPAAVRLHLVRVEPIDFQRRNKIWDELDDAKSWQALTATEHCGRFPLWLI